MSSLSNISRIRYSPLLAFRPSSLIPSLSRRPHLLDCSVDRICSGDPIFSGDRTCSLLQRPHLSLFSTSLSLSQKLLRGAHIKDLLRVPARLERKSRTSFTFTILEDGNERLFSGNGQFPQNKKAKLQTQHSIDNVMLDLMKSIDKRKIPMKVLKDVGELITLTINQDRNRQPLSGSTTFNHI